MRLPWLGRSTVALNDFLVLHPELEDFTILLLYDLLLLVHIFLHFVKGVLSGRDDILHALLGRWSAILPVITTMVD